MASDFRLERRVPGMAERDGGAKREKETWADAQQQGGGHLGGHIVHQAPTVLPSGLAMMLVTEEKTGPTAGEVTWTGSHRGRARAWLLLSPCPSNLGADRQPCHGPCTPLHSRLCRVGPTQVLAVAQGRGQTEPPRRG